MKNEKTYTLELTKKELVMCSALAQMHSTGMHVPIHNDHLPALHDLAMKLLIASTRTYDRE